MPSLPILSKPSPCVRWRRTPFLAAFIAVVALTAASPALADICKYLDKDGNIHYSNVPPEKGWKRISCDGEPSQPSSSPSKRTGPVEGVTARTTSPGVDLDTLFVETAFVDKAPNKHMRRWRPRAMGRATRIQKGMSHITIHLGTRE